MPRVSRYRGSFKPTLRKAAERSGRRIRTWHLMPTDRMGPPPGASPPMRMTASWSGSHDPAVYKSVTRRSVSNGELPSDPQQTDRHRIRDPRYRKARLAVHRRGACSGLNELDPENETIG